MEVTIIVIGDELLIGQVTDTNSGMIACSLAPYGWTVRQVLTVSDNADDITSAINRAFQITPVVLTTGGLGPTKDDITKRVLCGYFGGELVRNDEVLANVERIFSEKGLPMNSLTASQANVPTSCRVIQNEVGTAPIMWFERNQGKNILVAMPGVPRETSAMFPSAVLPALLAHFRSNMAVEHRTLLCYGTSESDLATYLDSWESALPPHLHLAYLPKDGLIRLRLDCQHSSSQVAISEIGRAFDQLKTLTARWMVADVDISPEELLLNMLRERHLMIASAESCTGGNIAHRLTMIPGSSDCVLGAVVSYSNSVKTNLLGVDNELIDLYGAVSRQVAQQMAEGVCRATGADIGVSTSGIAGPGGGSPAKPVGTVCISVHMPGLPTTNAICHLSGNRGQIIERASTTAIMMAIEKLKTTI